LKTILAVCLLFFSSALLAQSNDQAAPSSTQPPSTQAAPTQAAIDPAKEADIRHLLDVTGAKALMTQQMASMESTLRPLLTNSFPPGEYRDRLIQLFFEKFHSQADPETLVKLVIPVYDKYLSEEDIKGMIQFYSTPLGKKMIDVLPKLMAESNEAGQQWGQQMGRQTMIDVLQEHPDLREALEKAGRSSSQQ